MTQHPRRAAFGARPLHDSRLRIATAVTGALLTVAACGSAAGATPSAAASGHVVTTASTLPGSIVYLKNNNVWIANGDGTGSRAVTRDGTKSNPYYSPSESDTGVVVAAHSLDIVRMTQGGRVLNTIDPPALRNSAGANMDGVPADVAISPDGKRIAWTFVQYDCPVGSGCTVRAATGYTAADHHASAGTPIQYRAPSWVTNTRTLSTGGYLRQVMLHDISTSTPRHWFDDSQAASPDTDLADGEVSSDGKWLAEVRGYQATTRIQLYRVNGDARTGSPALPTPVCNTAAQAGQASPTWAPGAAAVAWQAKEGIWIHVDPANCAGGREFVALPGGSRPDWSAAPLR